MTDVLFLYYSVLVFIVVQVQIHQTTHLEEDRACVTYHKTIIYNNMETSIADSFKDGTVFITGSTGFLGKILTEKLLRSCSLKRIAILVRSKKGIDPSQRVSDVYNESVSNFFLRLL